MIPFVWQEINHTDTASTARAKVAGGWLVNVILQGQATLMTTNFIYDPEWQWEVGDAAQLHQEAPE